MPGIIDARVRYRAAARRLRNTALGFLADNLGGGRLLTSSCLSVHPPTWSNSAPTGKIFLYIFILELFFEHVEKIQVSLKSDDNDGTECGIFLIFG
jgi:hypothetical protein